MLCRLPALISHIDPCLPASADSSISQSHLPSSTATPARHNNATVFIVPWDSSNDEQKALPKMVRPHRHEG